ncbi:hypothetical protein ACVRWB_02165 [Streptococcus troglodytae]|uniref:hypothetical protein n=1 Tax=Streptococcus troglodytae TaxID=1111760 RepID=UPI0010081F82|nr:hypothetical protein [Streptococcus troglodytae]
MVRLLLPIIILVFFIWYLIRILRLWGKQSVDEPLWIPKKIGVGVSLNLRNTLGFWISLLFTLTMLIILIVLIASYFW